MEKVVLEANSRKTGSKSENKTKRKNGRIPGVFYIKGTDPISIDVSEKAIKPLIFTGETHLVGLKVDNNQELDCIIKDVQFDPVTDRVVHFDLLGLTSGETFELEVPIVFKGSAVGVKDAAHPPAEAPGRRVRPRRQRNRRPGSPAGSAHCPHHRPGRGSRKYR